MASIRNSVFVAIVLGALAGLYTGTAAASPCAPLPKVKWWGTHSHAAMISYVDKKYGGSWADYIAKWESYRSRIEDIHGRGGAAAVKKAGVRLEGARLAEYGQKIGRRVSVMQCLAKESAGRGRPMRAAGAYGSPRSEAVVIGASRDDTARQSDSADCPALPEISWWGTNSHRRMTAYVGRKYDGDWTPYIAKWERYEVRMRDILNRGGTAILKKKGIKMEGEALAKYAEKIEQRVYVMRCLAGEDGARSSGRSASTD
ncbi:MAG: hypothetical protein QGI63_03980 [Rhodospirillales bacterium]|nr:hypothetical protein [Rhodospirillales bacterium]MDP6773409.1 hypothetical protein [Rhodospirillales bacterium]